MSYEALPISTMAISHSISLVPFVVREQDHLVGRLLHLYTSPDSMPVTVETDYEVVIGLEVHAQLLTRSKMFCPCGSDYASASPNNHVCPICLGMPGVLPSINRQAVEATIMTALALNCQISGTGQV